ncbi:iron complex outermembrane receptor protein [Robbsia andropogonis]|uniref:TonB-dependent receptor n=1 Tax=Robbsia andropogonis TaxID=28092 RepID=UPI003D1EA8A5
MKSFVRLRTGASAADASLSLSPRRVHGYKIIDTKRRARTPRPRLPAMAVLATLQSIGAMHVAYAADSVDPNTPLPSAHEAARQSSLPAVIVAAPRADSGKERLALPVHTGSRLGTSSLDTPASVETLAGDAIRARGDTTVVDAVTRAAGYANNAAPGNGGTAVSVRGFTGQESITTLFDGTKMFVGAGTVTFPFDTWSVDRIEVLRGPASVLNGEGGMGGVINVIPKAPQAERSTTVLLGVGAYGEKRMALDTTGAVDASRPGGPMLTYRFYLNDDRNNGWLPRGQSHSTAVGGALQLDATPTLRFTLDYDYARQMPTTYFGIPVQNSAYSSALTRQNYNVSDARIAYYDRWMRLKTTWQALPGLTIRNQFYFMLTDRHWHDAESYALQGDGSVARSDYIEILHHQRQVGDRLDATLDGRIAGHRNRFVIGTEFNSVNFVDTSNTPYDGSSVVPQLGFDPGVFASSDATVPVFRTRTNQAAVFTENRLEVTDRLAWVSGVRYDHIDYRRDTFATSSTAATSFSRTFANTSWRTGLVFAMTPDLSVYGQYTTGSDGVGSLITLSQANSAYSLSTGHQWEAGIKQILAGGSADWTLAFYQIVKKNLLTTDPDNPTQTIQVGQQSSRGIEWTGALTLPHGIVVDANFSVLRARYDNFSESVNGVTVSRDGNVPYNVPQQTGNVWLRWAFAPGWNVGAGVRYVGSRYGDTANTVRIPSYILFDASASWRVSHQLTLALYLRNLTNRTYVVTSSNSGTQWLLGTPRSGGVTATMTF